MGRGAKEIVGEELGSECGGGASFMKTRPHCEAALLERGLKEDSKPLSFAEGDWERYRDASSADDCLFRRMDRVASAGSGDERSMCTASELFDEPLVSLASAALQLAIQQTGSTVIGRIPGTRMTPEWKKRAPLILTPRGAPDRGSRLMGFDRADS
jgi:hypothetical protein